MTKKLFVLPLMALMIAGCGNNQVPEEELKIICPTGAPALAFYTEANNENFVTSSTPTNVAAELQKNDYDVVVFDSINGLNSIKKNNSNYKLAKIITGGNFFLAGINKTPDEHGIYPLPTADDVVVSFGQNLIPDAVYSTLCSEYWHIENKANYVAGATDALATLKTGKYSGQDVDYVFIAEPALTTAMKDQNADTFGKVSIVRNIQEEWKKYSGQDGISQAGIFVHQNAIENKKGKLRELLSKVSDNIEVAVNNPDLAAASINLYGELSDQAARFGFNANVVKLVQKDGRNGFGLVDQTRSINTNEFLESLGKPTFSSEFFVEL